MYDDVISDEGPDDLSELQSDKVPDEVRKWLATTFAKQESTVRRSEERPSFKSVANAIRTGIFIERIYRRMSSSQLMVMPPEVQKAIKVMDRHFKINLCVVLLLKGRIITFYTYKPKSIQSSLKHLFKIKLF